MFSTCLQSSPPPSWGTCSYLDSGRGGPFSHLDKDEKIGCEAESRNESEGAA